MYKSNTSRSEVNQISGKDLNIGYNFKNRSRRGLGQVPRKDPSERYKSNTPRTELSKPTKIYKSNTPRRELD